MNSVNPRAADEMHSRIQSRRPWDGKARISHPLESGLHQLNAEIQAADSPAGAVALSTCCHIYASLESTSN